MVEAVHGGSGRPVAPEFVDQPVARDDLVRVQQEDHEEGALLRPTDRDDSAVLPDLERPEKPELQLPPAIDRTPLWEGGGSNLGARG